MPFLRRLLAAALVLALAGPAACDDPPAPQGFTSRIIGVAALGEPAGPSWAPAPRPKNGLATLARADATGFELWTRHGEVTFLAGVNLGSTVPGYQPGELALSRDDYRAWFPAMGRMGIRALRIYTIHPPDFYRELATYNREHPDRPLYLVQGVYLPDESYVEAKKTLYSVTAPFQAEIRDAVRAVHGDLKREPQRGRAGGTWDTDVSAWLAAWIIGVEWDPYGTERTDKLNAKAPGHDGKYFRSTRDASPTERWIAARLDELATAEAERGVSMPLAFTNWPTADPLRHPDEPLEQEDLVGVDANHVLPTAAWPGGTFASYHAYPYYPDFQRHEAALRKFFYKGQSDPYAGYLTALKKHHAGMPVMVTEFGVPSALGSAHSGPLGRDQGDHDEREAMRIDAELLRLIRDVGLAGGLVFEWTDEWFKFTWNTVLHQLPADRRQLWHDPLTNEQHFGLVATDPTGVLNPDPVALQDGVTARVDEAYLHLTVPETPVGPVTIGLDAVPTVEGAPPPGAQDRKADTAVVLDVGARTAQVWVRDEVDPVPLDYKPPAGARPASVNGWRPYQLTINRPLTVPSTGQRLPMEFLDVGRLRYGTWDPGDPAYHSLATWRMDGDVLRLRLPWALAGMSDPSSQTALLPSSPTRSVATTGIGLTVTTALSTRTPGTITWEPWQRVGYQERLKAGADQVRAAMLDVAP